MAIAVFPLLPEEKKTNVEKLHSLQRHALETRQLLSAQGETQRRLHYHTQSRERIQ